MVMKFKAFQSWGSRRKLNSSSLHSMRTQRYVIFKSRETNIGKFGKFFFAKRFFWH